MIFQGWDIRANGMKTLGMSLKIEYACKGQFSWSIAFNFVYMEIIFFKSAHCQVICFILDGSLSWEVSLYELNNFPLDI